MSSKVSRKKFILLSGIKLRFKEALSEKLHEEFESINIPYYYWNTDKDLSENDMKKDWVVPFSNKVVLNKRAYNIDHPADWLALASMEEQIGTDSKAISPTGYLHKMFDKNSWDELGRSEKTLCILQFICERTMGAPAYLQDLKSEIIKSRGSEERQLTTDDLVSAVFQLHFSAEQCDVFRQKNWIPLNSVEGDFDSLQYNYAQKAKFAVVIGKTLFTHSLNSIFPHMQDGSSLGLTTVHRAKVSAFAALTSSLLGLSTLVAFQSGLLGLSIAIAAAAAMFILSLAFIYLAYKAANTNRWSRWADCRDAELAQATKKYLALDPDEHFNWGGKSRSSLLAMHPAVTAGLPQNAEKLGFEHLAISVNSKLNVITEEYAKEKIYGNGIEMVASGHQPAANFPIVRRPYFVPESGIAVMTYEGDTGPGGLDGGVFLPSGRAFSAIPVSKKGKTAEETVIDGDMLVVDTQEISKITGVLVADREINGAVTKAYVAGQIVNTQIATLARGTFAESRFDERQTYYDASKVGGLFLFSGHKDSTPQQERAVEKFEMKKIVP